MASTSPVKNVILIGASGNLGPAILKAFLNSSFNVSVLSRPESKATFPSEVQVFKSDYSPESLQAAFKNQDAVVSIVGNAAFTQQQALIDAAIAAGVKRFIPSEFGSNTANPRVREIVPIFSVKRQAIEYLQSKESSITWTGLVTGPFFDWGLKVGFLGFNLAEKKATLWDDGKAKFAATNLSTIGKALVNVLSDKGYGKTNNQYVYVASHVTTQADILASFERATGAKWTVEHKNSEEEVAAATEKLKGGDYSVVGRLILGATFGKEGLGNFEKVWNEDLELPKEDLDQSVKEFVEGKRP